MLATTTRVMDACAPLVVWAPSSADAECAHGARIEAPVDHGTLARGSIALAVRAVKAATPTTLIASGVPLTLVCSLESGACMPIDHDAARFLHARRWLADVTVRRSTPVQSG